MYREKTKLFLEEIEFPYFNLLCEVLNACSTGTGGDRCRFYFEKEKWGPSGGASLEIDGRTRGVDYSPSTGSYSGVDGDVIVKWGTNSGHICVLALSRSEDGEWSVEEVKIGVDRSESFYPLIREVCQKYDIPLRERDFDIEGEGE